MSADVTADDVGGCGGCRGRGGRRPDLPAGVEVESGGVAAPMHDGFSDIGVALVAAVILDYLVMVIAVGSLVDPFTILFSIPWRRSARWSPCS